MITLQISGKDIIEIYNRVPESLKIVVVLIFIVIATIYVVKQWDNTINIVKGWFFKKKRVTFDDLKAHAFFGKCDMWLKYKINEMYFGDKERDRLFRIILGLKIKVMSEKCAQAIVPEIKSMNKHCFTNHVFKFHADMHAETQMQIQAKLAETYGAKSEDIYALVVTHKTKGFNAFNQMTDAYTECLIQIICDSEIYSTNIEKYDMILDAYKSALGAAFPHIETSFKGFNGELNCLVK